MPHSYTLDQLAWFNRCLAPGNFKEKLKWYGLDWYTARCASDFLKRNPRGGILDVYQEWIMDEAFIAILDQMVYDFINEKNLNDVQDR